MSDAGGEVITCQEVITFLWAYLDGELPPEKVEEFERHLEVCPSCVSYIKTYEQTVELTRGTFAAEAAADPADIPEDLVKAVLAAHRRGS